MAWTLAIIGMAGALTSYPVMYTIPMKDEAACVAAAKDLLTDSRGVGYACIDSSTGKVVRVTK